MIISETPGAAIWSQVVITPTHKTMSRPATFLLPNSHHCRIFDRFSDVPDVEEDDWGKIPFWPLLTHLLRREISSPPQFVDLLQTIEAVTNDDGNTSLAGDYGTLIEFLLEDEIAGNSFFKDIWPNIRDIALDLPKYFPDGELPILKPNNSLRLSRSQIACLVTHQFLCSAIPQRNDEGYQDFGIWYSSNQRHPPAVKMYSTALFKYLACLPTAHYLLNHHSSDASAEDDYVRYELHQKGPPTLSESTKLGPISIAYVKRHTTAQCLPEVQGDKGAVVVPSNKIIGFGQSATLEEVLMGIAPEACPAVLFAPHLADDNTLNIRGARAMLMVTGQRRDIDWELRPLSFQDKDISGWPAGWCGGNLILMDALEMDMAEEKANLPDLDPRNIDREILKAYIGFSSKSFDKVWTGLWGCGAFCGDAAVKLLVLWIAASAAGVHLNIMLSYEQQEDVIGVAFQKVGARCGHLSTQRLRELLAKVPQELRNVEILQWIENQG